MLIPADDYPLHQSPEPFAYAGTDRNFYDRFFFNGYDASHGIFFSLAMGVYPQLNIMDASFCVQIDGKQYNLRTSKEMNGDRLDLSIGPLTLEIVSPLKISRIIITDNETGMVADLTAQARHSAIEEPRFQRRNGTRLFMDVTRATQNIVWQGSISVNRERIEVVDWYGTRDRSWGIRNVGTNDPQQVVPAMEPQFYWLWTPANFNDKCFFFHSNDDGDGIPWNRKAVIESLDGSVTSGYKEPQYRAVYENGTRRIDELIIDLTPDEKIRITSLPLRFYMQGLGYTHPIWNHGTHHGKLAVELEVLDVLKTEQQLKEGKIENLHIQQLAEFELVNTAEKGIGVVEQLLIGRHSPSGFNELIDGYQA